MSMNFARRIDERLTAHLHKTESGNIFFPLSTVRAGGARCKFVQQHHVESLFMQFTYFPIKIPLIFSRSSGWGFLELCHERLKMLKP